MILKMFYGVVICLMLWATSSFAQDNNTYAIYVPKYIRPAFDISITVSILRSDNPVSVTAFFESSDNEISFTVTRNVNSGGSERFTLGQVPIGYDGSTSFTLTVTGVDSTDITNVLFENSTRDFEFETKALSILIQTDKAIYQPGQIIKFRAVCLKPDLKPLKGTVQYTVADPNGNIVLLERDVELEHGVAGSELQLSKDAVEGDWKVNFKAEGYNESISLSVEQYKLPKFKVEVEAPSYIYPGSDSVTIRLKGTYTFGKPVEGKAKLNIQLEYSHGGIVFREPVAPVLLIPGGPPPPPVKGKITVLFNNFDGEAEYVLTRDAVTEALGWDGTGDRRISVNGEVTETLTQEKFSEVANIDAKTTNIKVEVLYKPETIKPELFYTAYIQVTEQDGKPLTEDDRASNDLVVDIEYRYPRTSDGVWVPPVTEQRVYQIPASGIVTFTMEAKQDDFESVQIFPYTNSTLNKRWENQFDLKRALSPSNSYLQVVAADNSVSPGENAQVTIRTTEAISEFRILILSRGVIDSDETYFNNEPSNTHPFNFPVTFEMIPAVSLLASYVRGDGEIVADLIRLTVETRLQNQVSVSSSGTNIDAGDDVTITVQTSSPGAYVGARAIDQSVLLLKSGNDITLEKVVTDLNEYSVSDDSSSSSSFFRWWWWYPAPSGARDAKQVFKKAGLIVLTDALVYEEPQQKFFLGCGIKKCAIEPTSLAIENAKTSKKSKIFVRTHFPESWLWENMITNADGSATFNTTAPDTITSWQLSIFSVSDELGIGLTDPFKITVFRNFFIQLNFPLKITQNEIIIVQAIVFNYFETDLLVEVNLAQSDKFGLIIPGNATEETAGHTRVISIRSGGATSIKFPVRITTLGEVPITVSARSELAGDQLTRTVFVRPEGIEQCYSTSVLVDRDSDKDPDAIDRLSIKIPENAVPGSENVKLFVYGDVLGSTMSNLGNLLKMPSGCGEQNMLSFAPDVFVTLYLEQTNKLDLVTRKTAFQHFRDGYMNELRYRHDDGSFSAFGKSDKSGSTWLTAFVAKCFMFAQQLQPELVEDRIVSSALKFLIDQQKKTGTFNEPGKVSHKDMQGGVNSDVTMAAYVLITLTETSYGHKSKDIDIDGASLKAQRYLESQLSSIQEDKYALAIVTYALHASGSRMASTALTYLEALSTTEDGLVYWHEDTSDASQYSIRWRPPYYSPPSNDIEMTAYALLTYVRLNDLDKAAPVMKWLASKRSALGGYHSTQDTVIAIQAMAAVAGLLVDKTQQLTITTFHSNQPSYSDSFYIDETNSNVFNTAQLPAVNGDLIVSSSGTGVGVAQLSVCYNVPEDPFDSKPFICTLDVTNDNVKSVNVDFCCSLKPGNESTGMFLLEVNLLNGFNVDLDNEKEKHRRAQLVELDGDSINIYYDQLAPEQRLCANVDLYSSGEVGAVQPQPAAALDYYKPDRRVDLLYSATALRNSGACEACGSECVGCPGPQLGEWGRWSPCTSFCEPGVSTRSRTCSDPSTGKLLGPTSCGITEQPFEVRPCALPGFSCPTFHSGLWRKNELPEKIANVARYYNEDCYRYGRFNPANRPKNIPGTKLNGGGQYINCYNSVLRTAPKNPNKTVSFLVKEFEQCSGKKCKDTVFVKYGDSDDTKPYYVFKRLAGGNYKLEVNYQNSVSSSVDLENRELSPNKWNHIVLTWDESFNTQVYINGQSRGLSSIYPDNREFPEFTWRSRFVLGGPGSDYRKNDYEGYIEATFSSLSVWDTVLNSTEVENLYMAYQSIAQHPEDSQPVLSVRQLRQFSPPLLKNCFTKAATLDEIYSPDFKFGCKADENDDTGFIGRPFGPFF